MQPPWSQRCLDNTPSVISISSACRICRRAIGLSSCCAKGGIDLSSTTASLGHPLCQMLAGHDCTLSSCIYKFKKDVSPDC